MNNAVALAERAPELHEIEQFLYREARLLDQRRFGEWSELFTQDGVYWAPTRHDQQGPEEAVSLFYDTREVMNTRIKRLDHPDIHVQAPLSHTTHMVSNIELVPDPLPGGIWQVHAAFMLAEYRRLEPRWYAGRYEYHLLRHGGGFKIRMKKAVLVNCSASFTAMAVYI
jgi:ethylbenzene dioxygenase beta subunit